MSNDQSPGERRYGSGSPKPEGTLFEWLVCDFSVYDAFESGLVKIVRLPDPDEKGCCHKLPVDWKAITKCADTRTNYQLMPNDRIYVQAQALITIDTALSRFIQPIERVLGVVLLGSSTVHSVSEPLGVIGGGGF